MTARKRSGRSSAACHATGAPQSCPAMTDGLHAERSDETDHVAHEVEQRVLLDRVAAVGLAVAAHARRHDVEARVGERCEPLAPRVPGFRQAVAEEASIQPCDQPANAWSRGSAVRSPRISTSLSAAKAGANSPRRRWLRPSTQ